MSKPQPRDEAQAHMARAMMSFANGNLRHIKFRCGTVGPGEIQFLHGAVGDEGPGMRHNHAARSLLSPAGVHDEAVRGEQIHIEGMADSPLQVRGCALLRGWQRFVHKVVGGIQVYCHRLTGVPDVRDAEVLEILHGNYMGGEAGGDGPEARQVQATGRLDGSHADGHKCARCWQWKKEVGTLKHDDLCARCEGVLEKEGFCIEDEKIPA